MTDALNQYGWPMPAEGTEWRIYRADNVTSKVQVQLVQTTPPTILAVADVETYGLDETAIREKLVGVMETLRDGARVDIVSLVLEMQKEVNADDDSSSNG